MANGSVHFGDSVIVAIGGGVWLADKGTPLAACLAFGLGSLVGGILIGPDLDQDGKTKSETFMERLPIIGTLWFMFWYPYARAIKHRHWASHAPLIGTLGRLLYMGLMLAPLWWLLFVKWRWELPTLPWWAPYWLGGLSLSDAFHWLRDGKFSRSLGLKRFYREEKLSWLLRV